MRSLRSSLAITRIAPSSTFLRPIFQASATRIENCSIDSGAVVGTISTATWLPLRASKARSVASSAACSLWLSVMVRSTTRPLSGGTATSAEAMALPNSSSASRLAQSVLITVMRLPPAYLAGAGTAVAGAGALKSTFGAVEISPSLATEKFGFSL